MDDPLPSATVRLAPSTRERLAVATKVVVLTGAGISTSSGIPDFRGPDGVMTTDPSTMRLLEIGALRASADVRVAAWQMWRSSPVWDARPTPAHRALARADVTIYTQNFDSLHQAAGSRTVIEVHGNITTTRCDECGKRFATSTVLAALEAEPDPHCDGCEGFLRPDIVHYGEDLPAGVMNRAMEDVRTADALICIGSTLSVYPVAHLPLVAVQAGVPLVIVNREATQYDRFATEVLRDEADTVVPLLVSCLVTLTI